MPYRSVSLSQLLPESALAYYRDWLAKERVAHSLSAVSGFVRAHAFMFGSRADAVVQGYLRWQMRQRRPESPEAFAEYIAARYERWRAARMAARGGKRRPA